MIGKDRMWGYHKLAQDYNTLKERLDTNGIMYFGLVEQINVVHLHDRRKRTSDEIITDDSFEALPKNVRTYFYEAHVGLLISTLIDHPKKADITLGLGINRDVELENNPFNVTKVSETLKNRTSFLKGNDSLRFKRSEKLLKLNEYNSNGSVYLKNEKFVYMSAALVYSNSVEEEKTYIDNIMKIAEENGIDYEIIDISIDSFDGDDFYEKLGFLNIFFTAALNTLSEDEVNTIFRDSLYFKAVLFYHVVDMLPVMNFKEKVKIGDAWKTKYLKDASNTAAPFSKYFEYADIFLNKRQRDNIYDIYYNSHYLRESQFLSFLLLLRYFYGAEKNPIPFDISTLYIDINEIRVQGQTTRSTDQISSGLALINSYSLDITEKIQKSIEFEMPIITCNYRYFYDGAETLKASSNDYSLKTMVPTPIKTSDIFINRNKILFKKSSNAVVFSKPMYAKVSLSHIFEENGYSLFYLPLGCLNDSLLFKSRAILSNDYKIHLMGEVSDDELDTTFNAYLNAEFDAYFKKILPPDDEETAINRLNHIEEKLREVFSNIFRQEAPNDKEFGFLEKHYEKSSIVIFNNKLIPRFQNIINDTLLKQSGNSWMIPARMSVSEFYFYNKTLISKTIGIGVYTNFFGGISSNEELSDLFCNNYPFTVAFMSYFDIDTDHFKKITNVDLKEINNNLNNLRNMVSKFTKKTPKREISVAKLGNSTLTLQKNVKGFAYNENEDEPWFWYFLNINAAFLPYLKESPFKIDLEDFLLHPVLRGARKNISDVVLLSRDNKFLKAHPETLITAASRMTQYVKKKIKENYNFEKNNQFFKNLLENELRVLDEVNRRRFFTTGFENAVIIHFIENPISLGLFRKYILAVRPDLYDVFEIQSKKAIKPPRMGV